ncbi:MAG TPA: heparin lyase I family protein, partial [Burkholderiales bacterium]|nr:heparin lyase I family protein [Burkholderiales bacterium]
TKYPDGAYTVKAVAYDSAGKTATATRSIAIKNSTTAPTAGLPVVSFSQPTSGATLKGTINQTAACEVKGTGISQVKFYLDSTALNTELTAPYLCNLDTTKFANGSHTLMAVASNSAGSTTTQVAVKIDNSTSETPPPPTSSAVDPADVINQARASVPFRDQRGYNTQVINKYIQAPDIPETGIHGSVLSNGESLRLGKETDPRDSSKKALAFQLAPGDPVTSGSHRAEIKFPENMSNDKVYWIAFRHYVNDWGTLPTSDVAIIAMQLHSSGSPTSLSPAVKIVSKGGRTFLVEARGSTASTPSHSTSRSVYSPELPIKFNQWVDFVLKVKLNTSGKGFVQAWVDGTQVFNYTGTVGYNGTRPYMKFGYYNATDFKTPRKVLLRSPVVVADSTGSKYTAEQIRSFIRSR